MGRVEQFPIRPANDNVDESQQRELFFKTPLTYENLSERLPKLVEWFSEEHLPKDVGESLSQAAAEVKLMSEVNLMGYINDLLPILLPDSPAYGAIRNDVTIRLSAAITALVAFQRLT